MLTSFYRQMSFLKKSFHLLNPALIGHSGPSSGKLAPFILGKELKSLFFSRGLSQLTQEHKLPADSSRNQVQMRGLPFQVTTEDIINFFKPLNIKPIEVVIQEDRLGRPNGFAMAKFETHEDALTALRNHRSYIGQRYIELSLDVKFSNKDLSQRPLAAVPECASKGYGVILKGLPYTATVKDVIQFFAPLKIKPMYVEMKHTRSNLPSGICCCVFESQKEATTALRNHRSFIGRRWIEVILASEDKASAVQDETSY